MKGFFSVTVATCTVLTFVALSDRELLGHAAGATGGGTSQLGAATGGAAQGGGVAGAPTGAGQTGAAAQMGAGQPGTAGAIRPIVPPTMSPPGGPRYPELYGPNPWFANPGVQQHLRLNPSQLNQLNQAYQNSYARYQQQLAAFNNANANVNTSAAARTSTGAATGSTAASGTAQTRTAARPTTSDSIPSGTGTARAGTTTSGQTGTASQMGTGRTGSAGQLGTGQTGTAGQLGTGQTGAAGAARSSTATTATGTAAAGTGAAGANTRVGFNADGTSMSGANVTAQQRQATLEAQRDFATSFNQSLESILSDPAQRARFNQLHTQFRGFDAFADPSVRQGLNLTDDQMQRLAQFRQEWFNQMQNFQSTLPDDRQEALRRWNILRAQFGEQINQVLMPEQQRLWMQLYGEPFPFDFDVFFNSAAPAGATQDVPLDNRRSAAAGSPGAALGERGSTIGTRGNPTPGSNIGTGANPTPGPDVGTSTTPTPGSGVGSGAGTGTGTGTGRSDRK